MVGLDSCGSRGPPVGKGPQMHEEEKAAICIPLPQARPLSLSLDLMACAFKNLLSHLGSKNGGMKELGITMSLGEWGQHWCSHWSLTSVSGSPQLCWKWSGQRLTRQDRLLRLPQAYLSVAPWQGGERSEWTPVSVHLPVLFPLPAPPLCAWASEKLPSSFGQMKPGKQAWPLSLTLFCCEKDKRGTMKTQTDEMKADPCKAIEPSS